MRIRIEKWNYAGAVCRAIAEKLEDLGVLVLRQGSACTYKARPGDILINYGTPELRFCKPGVHVLNHPSKVAARYTKLAQYRLLKAARVPHISFTTDPRTVRIWLQEDYEVYARLDGNSSGGHGIRVLEGAEADIPPASVYTCRFNARREYRVHVFRGKVIDVSQKRRTRGREANPIRSYDNGYIFAHDHIEAYPESMTDACVSAVNAMGLDFGAVDVLLKNDGACAVLEVNSAPGMEGTTLDRFAEALRGYVAEIARTG
jgi:hypothetical protein